MKLGKIFLILVVVFYLPNVEVWACNNCLMKAATEIWYQVQEDMLQRRSVKASFHAVIKHGKQRENFDVILNATFPDKIFLQILDETGQRRYQLVADGVKVSSWDEDHGESINDYQTSDMLKFLGLKLRIVDLVNLLLIRFETTGPWQWKLKLASTELVHKLAKITIASSKPQVLKFSQKKPTYRVEYQYQGTQLQQATVFLKRPKLQVQLIVNEYKLNL